MEFLETGGSRVLAARTRAALDIWPGWLAATLSLDDGGVSPCSLHRTGGRPLLTRRSAAAHAGHSDFAVRDKESSRPFCNATGKVSSHLYVTPGSHLYVHYSAGRKKLLREAFVMKELETPPRSVSAGHGHLQHAGSGRRVEKVIRCHSYPSPESKDLPDAIPFSYRAIVLLRAEQHSLPIEKDPDHNVRD